jgi:hypothetical protein
VRTSWKQLCLAAFAAASLLLGGCGGISASHTVSPLDFFLPGAGGLLKGGLLKADPPTTNAPIVLPVNSVQLASVR